MAGKKFNMFGSVKKWILALMGKPLPSETPVAEDEEMSQGSQEPQEDSVANDIKMFKSFAKKGFRRTKETLSPAAEKGVSSVSGASKVVALSVGNKFLKILIRSFLVIFFLIILIYVTVYLFGKLKKEEKVTYNPGVTATPVPFIPYKPSVYAKDSELLVLEEEVNILEKELSEVNIKEEGINAPTLDFNISF